MFFFLTKKTKRKSEVKIFCLEGGRWWGGGKKGVSGGFGVLGGEGGEGDF